MVSRKQIKEAIRVLEIAVEQNLEGIKQELHTSLSSAKQYIDETEKKIQALTTDQGVQQSVFGFSERSIADKQIIHSTSVKNFMTNWTQRESDWKYPWCWISTNQYDYQYMHVAVKSHLVYCCSNIIDQRKCLDVIQQKNNNNIHTKVIRFKPFNWSGEIRHVDVPYNQIGTAISLDFLPYVSISQIETLLVSIFNILRSGGKALLHYADGDGEIEWLEFMNRNISYCSEDIIKKKCKNLGLECKFFHLEPMYSFVEITKPGKKTSIKLGATMLEPTSS